MAIYGSLGDIDVGAISKSISDTAVDVFVYDTRKDSDGGAWRKRTQHTSWYNETLNTATRGSRRDFPATAVIVGYNNVDKGLVIYDGDDPDFPMWMVFEHTSFGALNNNNPTYGTNSVAMLNGKLCAAVYNGSSTGGLAIIDFLEDSCYRSHQSTSSYVGYSFRGTKIAPGILNRNFQHTGFDGRLGKYSDWIVNSTANDVAMTVLPNAPIDSITGLPVPTIAIATNGGVSIIKDDGTVISSSSNVGYPVRKISIFSSGELYHLQGSGANEGICFNYPYTRISGIDLGTYANSSSFWYASQGVGNLSNYLGYSSVAPNAIITPTQSSLNIADNRGLTFVDVNKGSDVASHSTLSTYSLNNGMVAYATTSYNTGWMHGDIKGAFLSDTSNASVTGTELITNGNFSTSDLSAWTTVTGGTAVITGGLLKLTDTEGVFCYASAPFTTVIGKRYVVSVDIVNNGNTANNHYIRIGNSHNGMEHHTVDYGASYGTKIIYFTASATTTYLTLISGLGVGTFGHWDNVSVRLTEPDRSVNNKGLAVYGTITKTPVATGSDLVSYGNFNLSNYLYQPNVNINFANPWYLMGWFPTGVGTVSLEKFSTVGYNNTVAAIFATTGLQSSRTKFSDLNDSTTQEKFFALVYSDGILRHYAGPSLIRTITGTYTTETADLLVGIRSYQNAYDAISTGQGVSLLRLGQSALSPEQIRKIYEDEKFLFQPNSQCTLFGSSDAVTALAYDDSTNLLYAGTSSGRSDFQRLRRINNTTTAVTTAISASNGLIAEQ